MSSPSWFSQQLRPWYAAHRRPLPWRETLDPYRIWLSEVILQQTRVGQGLAYYLRFTGRWPSVAALAAASEDEVLKMWQGLGYYSRARNLLVAARQVMKDHGGRFPATHAELVQLKGVGDYTASAIASVCFGRPEAVVDGNVYRVLARCFGIATPIDSAQGRKQFKALATELLDARHPGDHNQAVMELGATVCTPRNPQCGTCPLRSRCTAYSTGTTSELPVKAGRTKTRNRYFNYLHIPAGKGLYLQQRGAGDIWQGLFELPLIESARPLDRRTLAGVLEKTFGNGWSVKEMETRPRHVLSHQQVHSCFWTVIPPRSFRVPAEWKKVPARNLDQYAVPRLVERWLAGKPGLLPSG